MSIFDKLKNAAIEQGLNAFNGYSLAVSESLLNKLAATLARSGETPISITCQPGAVALGGEARVAGVLLNYSTRLALESCEISPTRKVLTLRRLDAVDLGGNSVATALYARIVKILLCGLFGIDPARFALNGVAGVTVEKDLITADLNAMGATEIILEAIKAKLPAALSPLLEVADAAFPPSLGAAGNMLMARLGIQDIAIEVGRITGSLRIHPASKD
jgi:hypothetical protein